MERLRHAGPSQGTLQCHELVLKTAWHKCSRCRRAHSAHLGSPHYSLRDRLDEATYSWWMFVHQAPLTLTALHLGRKEDVVRRYYHHAAAVCARDAERRQARLVFGHRYPHTTICEADETRIAKFKATVNDTLYYYHLVLLGVAIRGDPAGFWLLLIGLTRSADRSGSRMLTFDGSLRGRNGGRCSAYGSGIFRRSGSSSGGVVVWC